jgi:hypothetical protein
MDFGQEVQCDGDAISFACRFFFASLILIYLAGC